MRFCADADKVRQHFEKYGELSEVVSFVSDQPASSKLTATAEAFSTSRCPGSRL